MSKSKIYIILMALGMTLLFYSILEMKPVSVNIDDFLGLTSHMTPAYWLGYIFIIICSIKLYLDKDIRRDYIYIMCLIIVGLFLFGISIFTEENARFAWSYYPAGEIRSVLNDGTVGKMSEYELGSYHAWPGSYFISAYVINIFDIGIDELIRYMPLFWVLSVILMSYGAGKLFGLPSNECFMTSLLVIASFWTMNYYYGPPSMAYILYMLFFLSIILIYKRNSNTGIMSTLFIVTTMTHMLTSLALMSSFFFSSRFVESLNRNRIKFMILFSGIFLVWNLYAAPSIFKFGLMDIIKEITDGTMFGVFDSEKYNAGTSLIRQIVHYSRISYLGIYAILMMIASAFYIKNRVREENRDSLRMCFVFLISALVLLALRYGAEIDDRVYMFSLLTMTLIIIMTFDKKVISILAIILLTLHIPAHYGSESFDMVRTVDLKGSEFVASNIIKNDSVNFYYAPLIRYYNNKFINSKGFDEGYYIPNEESLRDSTYIIDSEQNSNYLLYVFGEDKIREWLKTSGSSLLYDNGYYRAYKNIYI